MKTASRAFLAVLIASTVGLWGCSQQAQQAQQTKLRSLENRHAKLEGEHRNLVAVSDANQKKIEKLEAERGELLDQIAALHGIAQERDALQQKLEVRTEERDSAYDQMLQFSKDLQGLATRVQTAANNNLSTRVIVLPASLKTN